MRFVDAAEIRRVLSFPLLVDALEAAHRRQKIEIEDTFLGGEGALYFVRNAVDGGRYMASKLITSFPANLGGSLPAVQAVCVIFDGTNGRPLAVLDGTELTYWRTAADSALGARVLARPSPRVHLVVGAGEMSTPTTRPSGPVRQAASKVVAPEPQPTSSTTSPARGSAASTTALAIGA